MPVRLAVTPHTATPDSRGDSAGMGIPEVGAGVPRLRRPAPSWSGCRDLNPGPLDPQSSALTKLRHSPWRFRRDGNGPVPADRQTTAPDLGPPAARIDSSETSA